MTRKNRFGRAAAAAALFATVAAGCRDAPRAPAGSPAAAPVTGFAIGPQPGPDRPVAEAKNPFSGDAAALADGRRLFVWFNCSGCHGGRAGGGMGPSLRDASWLYGSTEQDIFNSIAQGRAHGMPAWGTKLPASEIWKLTSYIRSLDTDAEPDPPPPNPVYPDPPPRRDLADQEAGG